MIHHWFSSKSLSFKVIIFKARFGLPTKKYQDQVQCLKKIVVAYVSAIPVFVSYAVSFKDK